jgi:methyl-accepting chemotaxis protein
MKTGYFSMSKCFFFIFMTGIILLYGAPIASPENPLTGFDLEIRNLAEKCREEVIKQFEILLSTGQLNMDQLFDTFYVPIPNTYPQKYKTQYDKYTDERIQRILDKYLYTDQRILFVVIVDQNGYLPTHNSKFSQPLTGNREFDSANNRAKRLFNDRTGLAAARNMDPFLVQSYNRDTGETLFDLSVPIFIQGKHWGAVRIGYLK